MRRFFTELANDLVGKSVSDSINFGDYVSGEFSRRLGYAGDPASFFIEHGTDKLLPEQAEELAWQYAGEGASLGAIFPDKLRQMFERQHAVVPKEQWNLTRTAELDIRQEQDVMSYEEIEEGENAMFMAYCHECCPELYAGLAA